MYLLTSSYLVTLQCINFIFIIKIRLKFQDLQQQEAPQIIIVIYPKHLKRITIDNIIS
jgi:hypothetical protein